MSVVTQTPPFNRATTRPLTIEEQRQKWKRADEEAKETELKQLAALNLTRAQYEARLKLDYKPETRAERLERESFERTAEVGMMRTERTMERRRIAHEEVGDTMGFLLMRVLELEREVQELKAGRDYAIELAAKYKGFAAALVNERMKQVKAAQEKNSNV